MFPPSLATVEGGLPVEAIHTCFNRAKGLMYEGKVTLTCMSKSKSDADSKYWRVLLAGVASESRWFAPNLTDTLDPIKIISVGKSSDGYPQIVFENPHSVIRAKQKDAYLRYIRRVSTRFGEMLVRLNNGSENDVFQVCVTIEWYSWMGSVRVEDVTPKL